MAETPAPAPSDPAGTAHPLSRPAVDRTPSTADPGRKVAWGPWEAHPSDAARAAEAAAAQARDDDRLRQKNAQPPPEPPAVGSPLWARQAQHQLAGKSPQEVSASWQASNYAAMGDEARSALAREWGRPIHPDEQSAVPGVDSAVRKKWSDPGVQRSAARRADQAVPEARTLRAELRGAGIPPSESAYSCGPY